MENRAVSENPAVSALIFAGGGAAAVLIIVLGNYAAHGLTIVPTIAAIVVGGIAWMLRIPRRMRIAAAGMTIVAVVVTLAIVALFALLAFF